MDDTKRTSTTDSAEPSTAAGFTGTSGIDHRVLHRIRALLSKAESTTYPEEAAALTAKAHELMARHAIDQAMIETARGTGEITSIRIVLPKPYAKEKYHLLWAAAQPSGCRAILGIEREYQAQLIDEIRQGGTVRDEFIDGRIATVFGYRSDLDVVELLFTSLLLQAVNVMIGHGSVRDAGGASTTRSFRRAFLLGFAKIIHDRLEETRQRVTSTVEAQATSAATASILPVLADRKDKIDQRVGEAFPELRSSTITYSNGDGMRAGESCRTQRRHWEHTGGWPSGSPFLTPGRSEIPGAVETGTTNVACMSTQRWTIGTVTVTRVAYFDIGLPAESVQLSEDDVAAAGPQGHPWVDEQGQPMVGQAFWVLTSTDTTIVVDPCGASDAFLRSGPEAVLHQETAFAAFAQAGFDTDQVDVVVLSHLDGIGMTAVVDDEGRWRPAFPKAQILVSQQEHDMIAQHPDTPGAEAFAELDRQGHVTTVQAPHHLAQGIELRLTGGHSSGHLAIYISASGDSASGAASSGATSSGATSSGDSAHAVMVGHLAVSPFHLLDTTQSGGHQHLQEAADALGTILDRATDGTSILFGPLWPAPGAVRITKRNPVSITPAPGASPDPA